MLFSVLQQPVAAGAGPWPCRLPVLRKTSKISWRVNRELCFHTWFWFRVQWLFSLWDAWLTSEMRDPTSRKEHPLTISLQLAVSSKSTQLTCAQSFKHQRSICCWRKSVKRWPLCILMQCSAVGSSILIKLLYVCNTISSYEGLARGWHSLELTMRHIMKHIRKHNWTWSYKVKKHQH